MRDFYSSDLFWKRQAGPTQVGLSPGMSEAFPKPRQLVVQSRSHHQISQPCSFAEASCAQRVSPETPLPEPRGRGPYLVLGGCISLCCSRCPACRARRPAAVWRKQAAASQHHTLRFRSLCPSCFTRQHFSRGNAAWLQPEPRPHAASQPRLSRLSRKKGEFLFSTPGRCFYSSLKPALLDHLEGKKT